MPRSQRRYLESVSPYARRLFHQMAVPEVDAIEGLPPAVALQQQRGSPTTRSSVGSVTTLSNLLRMLYSRAGDYAPCPTCKGARYNAKTLEIKIRDQSIADVLAMTVDSAFEFFADDPPLQRSLGVYAKSASATSAWVNPQLNCRAARRSASSWRPNCSERSAARRCTSSTSRRQASIRPTSTS
jgi:excinuclease UvrABC ATPase subunit